MHIPVLQKEILEYLDPKPNENFIDCTIGEGGHTLAIVERILPNGKVLGIDWNPELIQELKFKIQKSKVKNNVRLVCDNFVNLREIVKREKFKSVQGILFDLGMSSWHLEESQRGFSFLRNEPLDMRYNPQNPLTAEKIVNYFSVSEIEKILREYGEERFTKEISQKIIEIRKIRPIETTFQLVEIIRKATPSWYQHREIHFATKTFQALRIAVNNELANLENSLPQAVEVLEPSTRAKLGAGPVPHRNEVSGAGKNGRLAIISFHSLEDRIVKNFYRSRSKIDLKILTKKPIRPSRKEVLCNPRSRSGKLRIAEKI